MKTLSFVITSLLVMLPLNVNAIEPTTQKITFPMSTKGKSVTLEFNGAIYNKVDAIEVSEKSSNEISRFIQEIIKANASKNKDSILRLWVDKDRSVIDKSMSTEGILERNASLFRNIKNSKLMGYIEYGKYTICYVMHDVQGMASPYLKTYPLIAHNSSYLMTNDLSNDFLFANISSQLGKYLWLDAK